MAWATEDAKHYLAIPEEDYIEVQEVTFASRQSAMFVGCKNGKVVSPSKVIGREEARSIIQTTQTAIQRIIKVIEFRGIRLERRVL
jgi:AbiV family abortive infection protein